MSITYIRIQQCEIKWGLQFLNSPEFHDSVVQEIEEKMEYVREFSQNSSPEDYLRYKHLRVYVDKRKHLVLVQAVEKLFSLNQRQQKTVYCEIALRAGPSGVDLVEWGRMNIQHHLGCLLIALQAREKVEA